eukprot:TRINITY_DN92156_c0_g1_i1.p1 TRINITY_DN92156_c0_g1~~TRINITY_DN92156_c0_g1_i1.p1  ORF type:complete len:421 (+),score=90.41 TRINITY_DN92156_c0_g1_i1:209-1471(+)
MWSLLPPGSTGQGGSAGAHKLDLKDKLHYDAVSPDCRSTVAGTPATWLECTPSGYSAYSPSASPATLGGLTPFPTGGPVALSLDSATPTLSSQEVAAAGGNPTSLWPKTMDEDDCDFYASLAASTMERIKEEDKVVSPTQSAAHTAPAAAAHQWPATMDEADSEMYAALAASELQKIKEDKAAEAEPMAPMQQQWPKTMDEDDLEVYGAIAAAAAMTSGASSGSLGAVKPRSGSGLQGPLSTPAVPSSAPPPPPLASAPPLRPVDVPPPPSQDPKEQSHGLRLSLAEAIPEPVVGSADCPTLGSMGHRTGRCKPCAFLHTRGCVNGAECTFCHLCEPGEKKRRQKEKKEALRKDAEDKMKAHSNALQIAANAAALSTQPLMQFGAHLQEPPRQLLPPPPPLCSLATQAPTRYSPTAPPAR